MPTKHAASTNKPLWEPGAERVERANISRFMRFVRENTGNDDVRRYAPLYDFSVRQPEKFWSLLWEFCGVRAHGEHELALGRGEFRKRERPRDVLHVARADAHVIVRVLR